MKFGLFIISALFFQGVSAQTADSLFIAKHVDSLIQVSRDLTEKKDFDKALEVNATAEKLALEIFGRESAAYGSCAFNRGRVNDFKRTFPEAEKWYLESKAIGEKVLGEEHPSYAWSLNNLANLYLTLGKYENAELLQLEAKAIREKVLGKEHPDYASSLNNLAIIYWKIGNYEKAVQLYLESIAIREKVLGKEHPDYASSLNNLATLYYDMGNFEQAETLHLETKAIREKVLGKEHPSYAATLSNLANLYKKIGNYEKAETHCLESKAIREKVLGKEHPDYAMSLGILANLYLVMGNYEKAEPLYIEAKTICEKVLGKEHPDYALSLNNLAIFYQIIANYDRAERIHLEAKALRAKVLGKEHSDYGASLANLATLYKDIGNYDKAELLQLESNVICEKVLGKEHPDYALRLNNLAILYVAMGNYAKAEPLYLESLSIREKVLGKEHSDYAATLNNLAVLYYEKGDYEKAELLYQECIAIREKVLGKENSDYAASLQNLAALYYEKGNYEKAEPLYQESKAIWAKMLGKEHPYYIVNMNNLANIYEIQFRYTESMLFLAEALMLSQARIAGSISYLSEQELNKYSNMQQGFPQVDAYIYGRPTGQNDILPALSYDQALFQKGFLMQAAARLQALASSSPEATSINNDLKGYRRRIANQLSKSIAERQGLEELEVKANTLEKELARTVAGYADALQQVKWQEVQIAIPNSAIALEFVHFRVNFPKETDSVMYAVLLLRSDAVQPQFIPLFEERELNQLLAVDKERKVENINHLYALVDQGKSQLNTEKKSLYALIWEKIEASGLEGINTVYYSPSGVLHRLNLGAIAVDGKTNLSDHYNLVALNSTRQLVLPASISAATRDAVVIGGVNYEGGTDIVAIENPSALSSRSLASYWTESATRGESWNYLNWTEKEADRIATTLNAQAITTTTIKGKAASEEVFKGIGQGKPSPRILHIATHGFFFPDPELKTTSSFGDREPVFKWSDNPMIRSGLVLAGANTAWRNETPTSPDMEDGILTAYEISQMNLSNTELVVLSACETGLGDIQGNEGVYGLQRAFKIAGAKYLIMSLWQVPDRPTMEFMTTFYKNWLEGNLTIPDAFRKTQREMRELYDNPYAWAGFVLVE